MSNRISQDRTVQALNPIGGGIVRGIQNETEVKEQASLLVIGFSCLLLLALANFFVYLISGRYFIEDHAYVFITLNLSLLLLLATYSPVSSLALLLAILPMAERLFEFEIWVITWNPYTLGVVAFSVYMLYSVFIKGKKFFWKTHDVILVVILLSFFASTMFSENIYESGYLYFHSLVIPFLSYALIKVFIEKEADFEFVKSIFFASITFLALYTFYLFLKTHTRPYPFGVPPIGVATLIVLPLIYWLLSGRFKSPFRLPLFLVNVAGLVSTASRVYVLSFLASPFLKKLAKRGLLKLYLAFMIVGLVFTVLISVKPEIIKPPRDVQWSKETTLRRLTDIDYYRDALYRRAVLYRYGFEVFLEHPILGAGLFRESKRLGGRYITQHNFHVEWLEYSGILGWSLFFLMFAFFFREAEKGDETTRLFGLIVLVMLMNSFTNGFMHGKMPYVIFVTMGFAMARKKLIETGVLQVKDSTEGR